MKHELERLGPDGFEKLIQTLMTTLFGIRVEIFGDGPDRQRETLIKNAHYEICNGVEALGRTIVQAKFKSPDGSAKDWDWLRKQLKKELSGFAEKAKSEPEFIPETWLFFTNLILTPAKGGLKDKADDFVDEYRTLIPHIYVLGADEIRALLDAHPEVARRYAAFLTPSDILADACDYLQQLKLEPLQNLMEHVRQRFQAEAPVRLVPLITGLMCVTSIPIWKPSSATETSACSTGSPLQFSGLETDHTHVTHRTRLRRATRYRKTTLF